jgi:predicted transposase YbfD/YdcC
VFEKVFKALSGEPEAVYEKSNEITAIPALVERLDLEGAPVSIDAMGCNPNIAQSILDGQG